MAFIHTSKKSANYKRGHKRAVMTRLDDEKRLSDEKQKTKRDNDVKKAIDSFGDWD